MEIENIAHFINMKINGRAKIQLHLNCTEFCHRPKIKAIVNIVTNTITASNFTICPCSFISVHLFFEYFKRAKRCKAHQFMKSKPTREKRTDAHKFQHSKSKLIPCPCASTYICHQIPKSILREATRNVIEKYTIFEYFHRISI